MITSAVISQYFDTVIDDLIAKDFPMLPDPVYSSSLSFDPDLRRLIVANDVTFKHVNTTDDWIGILWNREVLGKAEQIQNRRFEALLKKQPFNQNEPRADVYDFRMGLLQLTYSFVGTSLYMLEDVEESILVEEPRTSFEFDLGETLGQFGATITEFSISSLQKEENLTYGSIALLGFSISLTYPVLKLTGEQKALISEITFNVYDVTHNQIEITDPVITPDGVIMNPGGENGNK